MRKPKILTAGCLTVCLAWQACQPASVEQERAETDGRTVTFALYTPRQSRAETMTDFRHIIVLDEQDGVVRQVVRQTPSDADFGRPTLTLQAGTHTLRFFATDAQGALLTGNIVSQDPLGDSFAQTLSVNAVEASEEQRVVLRRKVAKVIYRGTHEVEVQGALFDFDLKLYHPTGDDHAVTMRKDDAFYSFIPSSGLLRLSDNTTVAVHENGIVVIDDKGVTEEPGSGEPSPDEILVWENDTALFYTPKREITGITLSATPDPMGEYGARLLPYRMPTRQEALAFHSFEMPEGYWSGARCLCYERESDSDSAPSSDTGKLKYYTFLWGDTNANGVTTAGEKTPYSIKPIRSERIEPVTAAFSLDADFGWEGDTTKVEYDF